MNNDVIEIVNVLNAMPGEIAMAGLKAWGMLVVVGLAMYFGSDYI